MNKDLSFPLNWTTNDLQTQEQIQEWFERLIFTYKLAFHPDDVFTDYVAFNEDKATFTMEDAAKLQILLDHCFEVCNDSNNKWDIYGIAIDADRAINPNSVFNRQLVAGDFCIGDIQPYGSFSGYYNPSEDWNGWAIPYFPKGQVDLMMSKFDGMKWKWDGDTVCYKESDSDEWFEVKPITINKDGLKVKVWPVGSSYWVWDTVSSEEKKEAELQRKKNQKTYIVCWTVKFIGRRYNNEKTADHWIVYPDAEFNGKAKEVAQAKYDELINKESTYVANITEVIQSTDY